MLEFQTRPSNSIAFISLTNQTTRATQRPAFKHWNLKQTQQPLRYFKIPFVPPNHIFAAMVNKLSNQLEDFIDSIPEDKLMGLLKSKATI